MARQNGPGLRDAYLAAVSNSDTAPSWQRIARFLAFRFVLGVGDLGIPAAKGETFDFDALPFKLIDFTPDKGVTYFGILVCQIGHTHGKTLTFTFYNRC